MQRFESYGLRGTMRSARSNAELAAMSDAMIYAFHERMREYSAPSPAPAPRQSRKSTRASRPTLGSWERRDGSRAQVDRC